MDESEETPGAGFQDLGLDPRLVATLGTLGYEEATPIQRAAIPVLIAGSDVLGQAATGTGKTAAFVLPIVQRLVTAGVPPAERRISALVIVPTRELAMQVSRAATRYGAAVGARALAVYGGESIGRQVQSLKRGVDVVIATPGRALDLVRRGSLDLGGVAVLVLDEADEMLDMGFAEDLDALLAAVPPERQTALFSATLPPSIAAIARKHLRNPKHIEIAREVAAGGEMPRVRQTAYLVQRAQKLPALGRILDVERPASALVFCRTRLEVDELTTALTARGHRAEALHGGLVQEMRDRVMQRFRSGTATLLVATDVAARGLDVKHLSHVVNFDVPSAPEAYVHRIGRTGRAGRAGVALTLVEPREVPMLRNIERLGKQKIPFAPIPTVADLHARQRELTKKALMDAAAETDARYGEVVDDMDELEPREVAAAAIRLLHEAWGWNRDEQEIPVPPPLREREVGGRPGVGGAGRPMRVGGKPQGSLVAPKGKFKTARLFFSAGRAAGIRPADLVGAIANETGLESKAIGAIDIRERHATVEVPDAVADEIVRVLLKCRIKGKQIAVRRDRA